MMDSDALKINLRLLRIILAQAIKDWQEDRAANMAAALAFYSALSLGPLLLIVIAIAGLVFGNEAASGHIYAEISGLVGAKGAEAIQTVIANSRSKESGWLATLIGAGVLFFAATAVFAQLQDSLNIIWKVKAPSSGILGAIKTRFLSFAMIVCIGFLLLISLIISAVLSAFGEYVGGRLPEIMMQLVHLVVSFAVTTLLFALIYKVLPDINLRWKNVWVGAVMTALLFSIGKLLIGLYIGHSAFGSTYGAAGSLMVVLMWIYYSALILFFGAEVTQVYTQYRGQQVTPKNHATKDQRH